jgi:PHP family Zn ribbon phosphoesterase
MREYADSLIPQKKPDPIVNYNLPPEVNTVELVARLCLKCDSKFKAIGKFNRICPCCSPKIFKQPWELEGIEGT